MTNETEEAILVAEIPKNATETIRIRLTQFRGYDLIDIRTFYPSAEGMKPGKGIAMQRSLVSPIIAALLKIEESMEAEANEAAPDSD